MLTTILAVNLWALMNAQQYMATSTDMGLKAPIIAQVERSVDSWIHDLRGCESGYHDEALNPKDSDGTRSVGRFQFKDVTFYGFAKKYGIKVTSVWNGDEQEQILRRMIPDKSVNFKMQFPDCVKKYGLPPGVE